MELTAHFKIPTAVCVNKFDINREISDSIARMVVDRGVPVLGEIPYDTAVTRAQMAGLSVAEYANGPLKQRIEALWQAVAERASSLTKKEE